MRPAHLVRPAAVALVRSAALGGVLVAAVALAGCQSLRGADVGPLDPGAEPTSPGSADLTVVVDATGEGDTTTWRLTCGPAGGDHPDADAACAAIAAAGGAAAFEPTPADVACTEQWGGPQVATVRGTVDGQAIDAHFSRTNGCEISRWDALAALLGQGGAV